MGSSTIIRLGNNYIILHIKITAVQNEVAVGYDRVRGIYFLAVIFVATIVTSRIPVYEQISSRGLRRVESGKICDIIDKDLTTVNQTAV